jgi:hypothetical protein
LRGQLLTLKIELEKAQAIANTSQTLMTSEKVAQEKLASLVKQLEVDNQKMRDDLGFFENLIPAAGGEGIVIRGLQAELRNGHEIKWQVLVIQARKNPPEFDGRLDLTFTGFQSGKTWVATLPGGGLAFKLKQYGRVEGVFEVPTGVVVKGVSAKVMDGVIAKAAQSIKL